ncbi:hypothetical protein [Oceaniradius stylonematis]
MHAGLADAGVHVARKRVERRTCHREKGYSNPK